MHFPGVKKGKLGEQRTAYAVRLWSNSTYQLHLIVFTSYILYIFIVFSYILQYNKPAKKNFFHGLSISESDHSVCGSAFLARQQFLND